MSDERDGWRQDFDPGKADQFERELDQLYKQVVQLNTNLYVLEKIEAFPLDWLTSPLDPFWDQTRLALAESSLMIIRRIAVDADGAAITLRSVRDLISRGLMDGPRRERFFRDSKGMDKALNDIAKRVKPLIDNRLAHLNRDLNAPMTPEQRRMGAVTIKELCEIRDTIKGVFTVLCIDCGRSLLPSAYSPLMNRQPDHRTDIERLLELVILDNELVKMPEEHWIHSSDILPDKVRELIQSFRDRVKGID